MNDELNSSAFQGVQNLYYAPKILEELYKALGCKNLSDRVFEDYSGTIAVQEERRNHPICHNIRAKVLGRLSMFLARYKDEGRQNVHRQMENDLIVSVYDRIEVTKVLHFPRQDITIPVKAGRYIAREDPEIYELWISETEEDKLDYFQ
jgi:hypothetical protein